MQGTGLPNGDCMRWLRGGRELRPSLNTQARAEPGEAGELQPAISSSLCPVSHTHKSTASTPALSTSSTLLSGSRDGPTYCCFSFNRCPASSVNRNHNSSNSRCILAKSDNTTTYAKPSSLIRTSCADWLFLTAAVPSPAGAAPTSPQATRLPYPQQIPRMNNLLNPNPPPRKLTLLSLTTMQHSARHSSTPQDHPLTVTPPLIAASAGPSAPSSHELIPAPVPAPSHHSHPAGSPSSQFPRLPGMGGGLPLPPLPSLPSGSSRNPMSIGSMVSSQPARPSHSNTSERPPAALSADAIPRIPDYVPRGGSVPTNPNHSHNSPSSSHQHLPGPKPAGSQSPPRPGLPQLHSARSSGSASASSGQAPAGVSRGGYPPLPSAFARENPYSPWPLKGRQDGPAGAAASASGPGNAAPAGAGSPPSSNVPLGSGQQSSGNLNSADPSSKTFFPSLGSYPRPSTSQQAQPAHSHAQPSHSQPAHSQPLHAQAPHSQTHSHSHPAHSGHQQQQQHAGNGCSSFGSNYGWNAGSHAQQPARQPEHPPAGSGGDYYGRPGYSNPGQVNRPPGGQSQKSEPVPPPKATHSPRFGAVGSMPHQPAGQHSAQPAAQGQGKPSNGNLTDGYRPRSESASRAVPSAVPSLPIHTNGHGINGSADHTSSHKRKRSEVPIARPPFVAPFTLAQQRQAEVRPPLLKVDSAAVLDAIPAPAGGRAHLGRRVYCPLTEPAQLLAADLLKNNIGGVIEMAVPVACLNGAKWAIGDPDKYLGEEEVGIPAGVWELEGLRRRKVWGTDIYTDDSDTLAMALHSGWLRLSAAENASKAEDEKTQTLLVKLLVAPPLIRYQGSTRQGIRSRSWGNSHDSVSLMVIGINKLETRVLPRGRKLASSRASAHARLLASVPQVPHHFVVSLVTAEDASEVKEVVVGDTFVLTPWAGEGGKGHFVYAPARSRSHSLLSEEADEAYEGSVMMEE